MTLACILVLANPSAHWWHLILTIRPATNNYFHILIRFVIHKIYKYRNIMNKLPCWYIFYCLFCLTNGPKPNIYLFNIIDDITRIWGHWFLLKNDLINSYISIYFLPINYKTNHFILSDVRSSASLSFHIPISMIYCLVGKITLVPSLFLLHDLIKSLDFIFGGG